jgi:hypothetical protein
MSEICARAYNSLHGSFCLLRLLKERSTEPDRKRAFIPMHSLKLITFQGRIDLESGLVDIGPILVIFML